MQEKALRGIAISNDEATEIFQLNDEQKICNLLNISRAVSNRWMGKRINFYYTSFYFPAISVTATECALNCDHCQRRLLEGLVPATTQKKLVETCKILAKSGAKGVLITGGCLPNGKVPIGNFLEGIAEVKRTTDLILIAHTGLIDFDDAKQLVEAGLDGVAVDVVGSTETTKAVYGIEITPKDYSQTLEAFEIANMPIVSPHVCVGLHFGELKHELESLRIISEVKPSTVVITVLMPLIGTPMENVRASPADVSKVIAIAKLMFPDVPITLGCARSKGVDRELIEKLAIYAGVSNIAIPTETAIREAQSLGMKIECYSACCAVPPLSFLRMPLARKVWR
jgi:uncharacterized radical SAM superfamily protein